MLKLRFSFLSFIYNYTILLTVCQGLGINLESLSTILTPFSQYFPTVKLFYYLFCKTTITLNVEYL